MITTASAPWRGHRRRARDPIAGTLLGPAVGVLAHSIGTEPVVSSVVVVAAVLSILALRLPIPRQGDRVGVR